MTYLTFLHPNYLFFLLIIPIIIILYKISLKKKTQSAVKFSNLSLIKSASSKKHAFREHINFTLSILIIASIIIGFSDPHIPLMQKKEGVNVILSIDVSGSMQAEDYKPNRLESAKSSAEILLRNLETNDQAGIVTFETGATTSAYLSPFKDKVINKLKGITVKEGRTAIGDGLSLAIDMAISVPNKKKVVILLSDGVNNAGVISPDEAIAFAKINNIQVNTIALGSNGNVILGYDWFGNPQYAELDEATLQKIAFETGGEYYKSVDDSTLKEIYKKISDNIKREKEPTSIKDWFFLLALSLTLIQLYVNYGKYRIIQ